MFRKFYKPEIPVEFRKFLDDLNELYYTDKQFLYQGNHFRISHLSIRRWILAQSLQGQSLCLRNLLLDAMMSAESQSPGSEIWVPFLLRNAIIEESFARLSSKEYIDMTLALTRKKRVKEIFIALTNICGPLTKIHLKPTKSNSDILKYRNSFQFSLPIDPIFQQMIGDQEHIEMWSPKIIMIEGAPSSVGEINSLLNNSHTNGENIVLVARSFPEEISATLATNWVRNSLNILPLVYGTSIDTINLSADLSAVTEGELISPQFGDAISSAIVKDEKYGTCDRIIWSNSNLQIFKNIDVSRNINNLLEKIKLIDEEELKEVYSDRITALSNDSVELQINDKDPVCIDEIDQLIKYYNALTNSGVCQIENIVIPKLFKDSAERVTESLKSEILKIAGFLLVVKNGDLV